MGILSKTHQSSLTLKGGIFSKITPSLFTIKEGSTSHPDPLTLREEGGNRSSSSLGTATL